MDLEKSLSEGAGLRGGYSTSHLHTGKQRVRVEEICLRNSVWSRFVMCTVQYSTAQVSTVQKSTVQCSAVPV